MCFFKTCFIIFAVTFLPSLAYGGETIAIKVEGIGNVVTAEEGSSRARDIAIEDALRKAVKQALGVFIESESLVQNAAVINDKIIVNHKGYIQRYLILEESFDGNFYKVIVEVHVSSIELQDDLAAIGLLTTRRHKTRVMVIIPEVHLARKIPDPAGETEIIKKFLEKNFKVVDQSQVAKIRYNDQVNAAMKGDTSLATKIGLQYGAEMVVIGEAFSESAGRGLGGMELCRARIEARAIKTDTGEILATDGKYASCLDITEAIAGKKAIQKAAGDLADYLIEQILAKWGNEMTSLTSVELVINGTSYTQFVKFKSALVSSVRSVKHIHQRSFTEGRAVVEIDLKGDAQTFANELALMDFDEFTIEITDFSANRLELKVLNR